MPCFSNFRRRCAIFVVVFLACFENHHGTVRAFSVPTSSSSSASITKEVVQSNNKNNNSNSSNKNQNTVPSTRRDFGAAAVVASLAAAGSVGGAASWFLAPPPVHAATTAAETTGAASSSSADGLIPYEDTRYKFKLMIPSSWETTPEQALPDRRKIDLWFAPNSAQKTLLFIAYTPTRGDFTSLGSFGVRTY